MIGTLFSLIIAGFLFFNPIPNESFPHLNMVAVILIVVAGLFLLVQTLLTGMSLTPLQKNEQNLVSHSLKMYKSDRNLRVTNALLLAFLLFTFIVVVEILFFNHINKIYLLAFWIISFGFSVDLLHHFSNRLMQYLDPYEVIGLIRKKGVESIQNDKELELCSWIDALTETGVKALNKNSISLCRQSVNELEQIMRVFFSSMKGFEHREESKELGIEDRASFTLFYFFQHLELVHDRAVEKGLEPISSHIIATLGKVAIHAAKYDMTLASFPIHYMGKFAEKAQKTGMTEVGNRANLTFLEVSKLLLSEVDIQFASLQEAFLSLITYMSEISEETFRQNKETSIELLKQPFKDLKEIFSDDKIKEHQDRAVIIKSIDNVIDEFNSLQQVLATMPKIKDSEDTSTEE